MFNGLVWKVGKVNSVVTCRSMDGTGVERMNCGLVWEVGKVKLWVRVLGVSV